MTTTARITTTAKPLLLAAGVALAIAGCGSSDNNDNTNGAGRTGTAQSFVADAYRYSACMRSHGVPSFPDPHVIVNTPGKQAIGVHPLPQSIASSPQFKAAREACKGIMPAPGNGGASERNEAERARAQYLLPFAQCLRAHGVQGFPDPTAQGKLTLAMVHAAGVDLSSPAFLAAAQACVAVTHGAITLAQVEQAIHHTGAPEASGGGQGEGSESSGGQ